MKNNILILLSFLCAHIYVIGEYYPTNKTSQFIIYNEKDLLDLEGTHPLRRGIVRSTTKLRRYTTTPKFLRHVFGLELVTLTNKQDGCVKDRFISGFHHDYRNKVEKTKPNVVFKNKKSYENGLTEAQVFVDQATSNLPRIFFPADWKREEILQKISSLLNTTTIIPKWSPMKFGDGRWVVQGTLQPESIPVRIVLEKNGDLVTAFPLGEF